MRDKIGPMLGSLMLLGCTGGGAEGTFLSQVQLSVDFGEQRRSVMTAQTPETYTVALQQAALLGEEDFELLSASPGAPEIFSYTPDDPTPLSLHLGDTEIPERAFSHVDLGIVYLEMVLPFSLDESGDTVSRTLRIYFEPTGAFLPGDVTVVSDSGEAWVFGPGNVGGDPMMLGLPREDAYTLTSWPDGRSAATSGPFGNSAFWDFVETDPFHWEVWLDPTLSDAANVTVQVEDTWNFTDQDEDGVYDWPSDYGEAWSMDFPEIVAL